METLNEVKILSDTQISVNEQVVEIINKNSNIPPENIKKAITSMKFQNWLLSLELKQYTLKSIEFRDVFMFGPNVGFICVNCVIFDTEKAAKLLPGEKLANLPGYAFIRGDAVAILVIVVEEETGKKYVLLTEQFRLARGGRMLECPAGMMDDSKNFKGQAATELEEEAGLVIDPNNLTELLTFIPSGGGCDEKIQIFYTEIKKSQKEITEILQKIYGLQDHGEVIKIKMLPFDVEKILAEQKVQDSKLICALFAYQNLVLKALK